MARDLQSALDSHIKKIEQLRELLSDPTVAAVARALLSEGSNVTTATGRISEPRRRYKRHGGSLVESALEAVKRLGSPVTARSVAEELEKNGYRFHASNKNVAVSKVLRALHKEGRLTAVKGEHEKAAILYSSSEMGLLQNPVQVIRQ
jgi:hypothetical protein